MATVDYSKSKTILGVQYLRGLAAISVVLCHYGSGIKSYPMLAHIFNAGQNGVQVFFLISGFIITFSMNAENYKINQFFRFLVKRSIRIDPSYFATIVLTLVVFNCLSVLPSFKGQAIPFIPGQFLAHIFYIVPFTKYPFYNHVFWTLCIEFQFYLLIGVLYFLSDSSLYKKLFLILFSITCLIPTSNSYYLVFTYAPIFSLGISLVSLFKKRDKVNYLMPLFLLAFILIKFGALLFIILFITSIVILTFTIEIKPLFFLGKISYSLYLTHSLIHVLTAGFLKRFYMKILANELLFLFVETTVAITAGYVFYLLVEKPSKIASKKIQYTNRNLSVSVVDIPGN